MNWTKKFFLATLVFLLPVFAQAQIDINIFPGHQPYVQLGKNLVWGNTGVGGANNYFIFSPLNPDQRYCGFIVNNNPTTAHSYTLSAWQTGDPNQSTFINNVSGRWIQDTVQGNTGTVAAGATTTFYVHANAGARFAISLTGATTQAGVPDTLDFFVVQTTGESCGPTQFGTQTDSLSNAAAAKAMFTAATNQVVTAPAGLVVITNLGSATKNIYIKNIQLTCSVANCLIDWGRANGVGVGCSSFTIANNFLGGPASIATATAGNSCSTTQPLYFDTSRLGAITIGVGTTYSQPTNIIIPPGMSFWIVAEGGTTPNVAWKIDWFETN